MLNKSVNISTANVAPLYMVPQKITTPKAHMIVAIRVAYGMRVRHLSKQPENEGNSTMQIMNTQPLITSIIYRF